MRRASLTPALSLSGQEPLIVVEESGCLEEEEPRTDSASPRRSLDIDSPQNPYLLSPWRDPRETRKHSLPTPSCTSGITASQVRRLSERGGEGSGPSPREAAFLATLSTAPAPQPGGRRHSVVTISRVPPALFGRNRRESVAALPAITRGPPATDRRGSSHNLQLDIMDDIVTARKVRMKMWNTSSERVCEVQPLDEAEPARTPQRYTHGARRYSDFVGCTLPVIPSGRRRASEQPPARICPPQGIVCSDVDLISIVSSLASSATEINRCGERPSPPPKVEAPKRPDAETRRSRMKSSRSNSFDVSVLHGIDRSDAGGTDGGEVAPSGWFVKRHQTMADKRQVSVPKPGVSFVRTDFCTPPIVSVEKPGSSIPRVVWDKPTGSVVDAQVLGSAIEVFLRQTGGGDSPPTTHQPPAPSLSLTPAKPSLPDRDVSARSPSISGRGKSPPGGSLKGQPSGGTWYSAKSDEEDSAETCDTSLCSTLKDLFVK